MDGKKREAYFKRVEQEPFARLLNIKMSAVYCFDCSFGVTRIRAFFSFSPSTTTLSSFT